MVGELLYEDITEKIIGAAFKVFNTLGQGLPEKIYQSALEYELKDLGIKFHRELYCDIKYENHRVGSFRLDFLVENKVAVEIKARDEIHKKDISQLLTYLKVKLIKVGLLIVFTCSGVKFKRFVN